MSENLSDPLKAEPVARSDRSPATKQDLRETEARLIAAIKAANTITFLDQRRLDSALARTRAIAARLASLDAKTPPATMTVKRK